MTRSAEPDREILYGLHPVEEALRTRRRQIDRLWVAQGTGGRGLGRLLREAREAGVPITHLPREVLARRAGRGAVHQGIAAVVAPIPFGDAEEVCRLAVSSECGLLVVLDGVEDPRNLGAIVRSAAAAGAQGVLLAAERSVGLTPIVAKTSAGALDRLPVAREVRLGRRLEALAQLGFTAVALDPRHGVRWDIAPLSGRIVIVAGGEGRGLSPSVLGSCRYRVRIPLAAEVESLNVSVAVSVVLFEVVRRRLAGRIPENSVPGS